MKKTKQKGLPPNIKQYNKIVRWYEIDRLSFIKIGKKLGLRRQTIAEQYHNAKELGL